MPHSVFTQLEEKIDLALETIELLRMQIEELQKHNATLKTERDSMLGKQSQFENSISGLLEKLKTVDENQTLVETKEEVLY